MQWHVRWNLGSEMQVERVAYRYGRRVVGMPMVRRPRLVSLRTRGSWRALFLIAAAIAMNANAQAQAAEKPPPSQGLPALELSQELELSKSVRLSSVAWSSDGTKLAAYTTAAGGIFTGGSFAGREIAVWNANGQLIREIRAWDDFYNAGDPLVFVSGDKEIVTPSWNKSKDLALLVFDVDTGAVLHELPGPRPDRAHYDNVAMSIATPADQSMLAVVFGFLRGAPVGLYSTRSWTLSQNISPGPGMRQVVAFSPDGKLLAIAQLGGKIILYDLASKQPLRSIESDGVIRTVLFSPDGAMIAVADSRSRSFGPTDSVSGPVQVFSVENGSHIASVDATISLPIINLAWNPTGGPIAFTAGYGDTKLYLWDLRHPEASTRIVPLTGFAQGLAFSPDGTRLAVTHETKISIYGLTK